MKFKVGEKVKVRGTGGSYSKKLFISTLLNLGIDLNKCYNWSEDIPLNFKNEIKEKGVTATVVSILEDDIYILKYETGMHSIISNIYNDITPIQEENKGNIKYRIKDGITYVTLNKTTKGMSKVSPKDTCDNKKGILIATTRALFDEEVVQKIVDVLYGESPKKLQDISTCEILCELERRIIRNQNN